MQSPRHDLKIEQVGNAFNDQAVRADEERLHDIVSEGALQREQAITRGIQDFNRYLGALLRKRKIFVSINAPILNDPDGLGRRALELIVQQTQWSDVTLTDDGPPGDGAAGAEVRYGSRRFGDLCSRKASLRQLRPWAEWLARWLALDRGYRDYRVMAFRDELTGAWNRRFYGVFMRQIIEKASRSRRPLTLLVFDIDDFKRYNDEFGHAAGDDVLRETVRLLNSVIRTGDRVCRIGGDEFVVIFADPEGPREPGSNLPETVEAIAGRFQDQICQMKFPKLGLDAPGTLSISGGLSTYPWDGTDPESLFHHADQLALQSKKKGKNVITLGPGIRRI